MKKRVAIITQGGRLSHDLNIGTDFHLFDLNEDQVVQVDHAVMKDSNKYNLLLWLLSLKIDELYLEKVDENLRKDLNDIGVTVKEKKDLVQDPFFNRFIFD